MHRFLKTCAVAIGAAVLAAPAGASGISSIPPDHTAHTYVSYRDLNLSDPHDAKIMLARLKDAARRACGYDFRYDTNFETVPLLVKRQFEQCIADAVGKTVAQLNFPALSRSLAEANSPPNERVAQH